jgi:hypothetical protein
MLNKNYELGLGYFNQALRWVYKAWLFTSLVFLPGVNYAQCLGTSGNLLVNPDFEIPVSPVGNNILTWPIPGWTGVGNSPNIVRPSSTFNGGGPNAAQNGAQYLDIVGGSADFWQEFNFTCNVRVFFSGYFSVRVNTPSTGRIDIYRVDTLGGPIIVASSNGQADSMVRFGRVDSTSFFTLRIQANLGTIDGPGAEGIAIWFHNDPAGRANPEGHRKRSKATARIASRGRPIILNNQS